MGFNSFPFMEKIAFNGTSKQEVRPGDYYDAEGLLVCGTCKKNRQNRRFFPNPSAEHPDRMSPLIVVTRCDCDLAEEAREKAEKQKRDVADLAVKLRGLSLMDQKSKNASFETYQENQFNAKNLILAKRYAYHFDEMVARNQGLMFYGDVGTGKSWLAACIANHLINRGVSVLMTSFVKILQYIDSDEEAEREIITRIGQAKLVIFDDLGAERGTNYGFEKIYNIIDSRYRRNLPMIITTNIPLQEMLAEMDMRKKRIYDRLFEACYPMQFTGPSWRQEMAAERFDKMKAFLEGK